MKKLFLFLSTVLACGMCHAQTLTPTLSEPFSYPGSTVVMTVAYANSNTTQTLAGVNFTVTMPTGITFGAPVLSPGSPTGSSVACSNTTFICVLSTNPSATFVPGTLLTVPLVLSSSVPVSPTPQPITLTNITAVDVSGNAVPMTATGPASLLIQSSTGTTTWFSVTTGQATCRVSKVAQTPIRLSWVCFNHYGANSGSYTVDVNNGGGGMGYFPIGISSIAAQNATLPDASLQCTVQINGTQVTVSTPNGSVAVPPNSAAYSCSGYSTNGTGSLSWP